MAQRLFALSSLRFKLMIAAVVAAMILIGLLVGNSIRLIDDVLVTTVKQRVAVVEPLLVQALRDPVAHGDFVLAKRVMNSIHSEQGISYIILLAPDNQILESVGWTEPALPKLDITIDQQSDVTPDTFDTETVLAADGNTYCTIRFGVSKKILVLARQALFQESSLIGGVLIILLILLLLGQGFWITKGLALLTRAGEAITKGDYGVRVPVTTRDEVGQLSQAFNTMAEAVQDKVRALREGEAKFHAIADYSHDLEI